ncbi:hypothetical protein ACJX0J_025773, partial [Zea mays]
VAAFIFVGMHHGFFLDLSVAFKKGFIHKLTTVFEVHIRYLYSFVIFSKIVEEHSFVGMNHCGSKSNKKDYPIIYFGFGRNSLCQTEPYYLVLVFFHYFF